MRFYIILSLFLITTGLSAQQYNSRYASNSNNGETGTAVYYADYLHGRITAMGEVYRREAYTAAHKTYPKGTLLKVTRLDNGLSTVVRVNDRGPFTEGVSIDLSKAAAMDIGLLKDGRAQVSIEPVGRSDQNPRNGQLAPSTTARSAPTAYDSYTSNRTPAYSSSSYEPQYPAAAARNSYSSSRANTADYTAKGNSTRYSAHNSAPPVGQAYSNNNYSTTPQAGTTYTEPYSTTNNNLTAKGGYSKSTPQSYGQVGGALADRAPGATQTSANEPVTTATSSALPRGTQGYAVQVGSYRDKDNAARQVEALKAKGLNGIYIMDRNGLQKVVIAPFPKKADAQKYLDDLRRSFMIDGLVTMIR